MQGQKKRTPLHTWRMLMSLLPMEWRLGPALEQTGRLATTRKMLLLVRAERR
jgi:hypothetical protein